MRLLLPLHRQHADEAPRRDGLQLRLDGVGHGEAVDPVREALLRRLLVRPRQGLQCLHTDTFSHSLGGG